MGYLLQGSVGSWEGCARRIGTETCGVSTSLSAWTTLSVSTKKTFGLASPRCFVIVWACVDRTKDGETRWDRRQPLSFLGLEMLSMNAGKGTEHARARSISSAIHFVNSGVDLDDDGVGFTHWLSGPGWMPVSRDLTGYT